MGDGDAAFFDERDEFVVEVCDVRLESLWAEKTKLEEKKNKKEIKKVVIFCWTGWCVRCVKTNEPCQRPFHHPNLLSSRTYQSGPCLHTCDSAALRSCLERLWRDLARVRQSRQGRSGE